MVESFYKFPSTPHLAWFGSSDIRADKVMSKVEAAEFLLTKIVVEEKVDGANLALFFDERGVLCFQNRGNLLNGKLSGQWERLRGWVSNREESLRIHLPHGLILFGEWCYARHTVVYDCLPDWFLGFDVFDPQEAKFWSTQRRNELLNTVGMISVPQLDCGHFSLQALEVLLNTKSKLSSSEPVEGVYLRRENPDWLETRCKLVRSTFQQAITQHWSTRRLEINRLSGG